MPSERAIAEPPDVPPFSLTRGGPWFRIQRSLGLIPSDGDFAVRRRILVLVAVTWLPPVVLLLVERAVSRVESTESIFGLLGMHARLLGAVPLFILAEPMLERGLGVVVAQLVRTGLVTPAALPAFRHALRQLERVRDSWIVFAVLAVIVTSIAWRWFLVDAPPDRLSWAAGPTSGAMAYGLGGMWYLAISKPLADLILAHWLLRLVLVGALMWKLSRLGLDLVPAHPDQRAGMGFLADLPLAFTPVVAGVSLALAGELAHEMLFRGQTFIGAVVLVATYVVVMVVLVLGPLLFFLVPLTRVRLGASLAYGALLARYNRAVHRRWIDGEAIADDPLLSASEVGPAVDAGAIFERVRGIVPVPFDTQAALTVVAAATLPIVPAAAIEFSVVEMLGKLVERIL